MQPRAWAEVLAQVLAQVPSRLASLANRARADREVAEQLDVDEAVTPGCLDPLLPNEPADREVGMEAMPARVPLGNPEVRKGLPKVSAEPTAERRQVGS